MHGMLSSCQGFEADVMPMCKAVLCMHSVDTPCDVLVGLADVSAPLEQHRKHLLILQLHGLLWGSCVCGGGVIVNVAVRRKGGGLSCVWR